MDTLTFWEGKWHDGNPALMGPRDHGFWLGSIVFDGGRAFQGFGPDLDRHAARVVRSAIAMGLKPTKTAEEIFALSKEGVAKFAVDQRKGAVEQHQRHQGQSRPGKGEHAEHDGGNAAQQQEPPALGKGVQHGTGRQCH